MKSVHRPFGNFGHFLLGLFVMMLAALALPVVTCLALEGGDLFVGNVTNTSATIMWTTDFNGVGTVAYGTDLETYGHSADRVTITTGGGVTPSPGDLQTDTVYGAGTETPVTMAFSYIPSGTFTMGSPSTELGRYSNETQHSVTLTKGFYMARYEVTQAQWTAVMGSNPSSYTGDNRPVEKVTWYDCAIFCNRVSAASGLTAAYYTDAGFTTAFDGTPPYTTTTTIYIKTDANGYRLPTEAEWEYACRAGTTRAYNDQTKNGGEGSDCLNASSGTDANLDPLGRYGYNQSDGKGGYSEHTAVGSYQANAWNLYDMHGNVWEWCSDWYGAYPAESVSDPYGPASGFYRVFRGGSWYDFAFFCRSALRIYAWPDYRFNIVGFRPVRADARSAELKGSGRRGSRRAEGGKQEGFCKCEGWQWKVASGKWEVASGQWTVGSEEESKLRTADCGLRTADCELRTANCGRTGVCGGP